MTAVHLVVPDGIDDPARPSGGNVFDRHICRGLATTGWTVHEHPVPGDWPRPDGAACAALAGVVGEIPDGAVVLIDGLVASAAAEVLVPEASRLRLVVLVHMPIGDRREDAVLATAAMIITTSAWTRRRLLELHTLPGARLHVVHPGVEAADLASGTPTGEALLCVAAVIPAKGHDVLLDALATTTDLAWHCVCVGTLDRDPVFAERLRRQAIDRGIGERVRFTGARPTADLVSRYAASDVIVLPSRAETYGMVVTEGLARGLPVVATEVGGLTEALGHGADGARPGLLVPPDDPAALGGALRSWLTDAELRGRLRRAARERRATLGDWAATTAGVARVLAQAAA